MNKELIKQLELLRSYKEKGCLDLHYKLLIDYIDELEEKKDKAIEKLICWGEVLDAEFQKEMLDILEGKNE